jgi:iron complex outermembrane receptor protein
VDVGGLGQILLRQKYIVTARAAVAQQRHDHQFGDVRERDRHTTAFGEVAVRGNAGTHTWVAGAAIEHDRYNPRDVPRFGYSYVVPGVFLQDDVDVRPWLSLSLSGRVDHHSEYGTFFSPRISALARAAGWTSRFSVGGGFFPPTPLTEETEAAGLSRLMIDGPLQAERGRSVSVDVGRAHGPLSYTVTLFGSRVAHPIEVERTTTFVLRNLAEPTANVGVELLGTLRRAPFALTGTYTYVRSRELDEGIKTDVPLTPRHSAGLVAMAESEDVGRVGLEFYFTGEQRLELNPYRQTSEPYWIVGFLAERRFKGLRVFVNAENVTGVRQTKYDPLLRPSRAVDGRWTVDAWAPLEGRVINGGVRVGF